MGYNELCSSQLSSSSAPRESKVQLPAGFYFDPEDGELIVRYLLPRCLGLPADIKIPDIRYPYQHPSTLKRRFEFAVKNECYFFTKWKPKSDRDSRKIRSINGAFWKATSDRPMPVQYGKKMVGHKKRFTLYEVDKDNGQPKKTDWIMHEYEMDVPTLVGDGKRMLEEYVLCKLYNNNKSSNDSPNVRSDPHCPSSPDITSSRVQRQDAHYNDNGVSFVSQSSNVDTPKVVQDAVTSPDVLLINNDNQVQHSAPLSGANLSSAPYSATLDMSWSGILQKEVEHCNGEAYSVLPQFSNGMPSMEVYNLTLMNVDPLVQNPFQLSDAELSSETYSSSQDMASMEMHPATPYCNPAMPSTTQRGNGMLADSSEMMEVDGRVLSNEGQLVQFPLMQQENMPQGNTPLDAFTTRLEELKSIMNEGHPHQRAPQQQEDMSLACMSYPNDYMEQDGFQRWQHPMSEDYPHQLEDIFEAYTPQEALQTFQVEFMNEDYLQSYALWHEEGTQRSITMNNSQQQHAPQHDEDDERLPLLLEGFKH